MTAVIFIGIQASGKSTFFRDRFFNTHVRINLDMLKTRHREELLFKTCLEAKQSFVVDNTNCTRADRARYIPRARDAGFQAIGYYFQSVLDDCRRRNAQRPPAQLIPERGLFGAHARLEQPSKTEGFDELFYVKIGANGDFEVEDWRDEVR